MDHIENMSSLSEYPGSSDEQCKIECIDVLINSKDVVSKSISTTSDYNGSKHDVVFIYALLDKCIDEITKITKICSEYEATDIIAKYGELFKKNITTIKNSEPGFTEAFTCLCVLSKWIDNSQNYIFEDFEGNVIKEAVFSSPIRIIGFNSLPKVGATFRAYSRKKDAELAKSATKKIHNEITELDEEDERHLIPIIIK
ncbi:MAG: hypothetical protein ACC657_15755, partial [Thiohalomonadales bacterium]